MNLVEISITALILAVGIAGEMTLLAKSTQVLNRAHASVQETWEMNDKVERWRSEGNKGCEVLTVNDFSLEVCN